MNNGFTFNGVKKPYVTTEKKERPVFAPLKRNLLYIPGMPGAYLESTNTEVRIQPVTIWVDSEGFPSLQKLKEDLAAWLLTNQVAELVFDDELDRIYYAAVDGTINLDELVSVGHGVITFICPDPYKYGPEISTQINKDTEGLAALTTEGTVMTPPEFEIALKGPTTFLDIIGENDYMRIGQPGTVEQTPFKKYEQAWGSDGTNLTGWGAVGFPLDDGAVRTGAIASSSGDFIATDYGAGSGWHGPALAQSIGTVCSDYIVRAFFNTAIAKNNQRPRTEVYLVDAANQVIGKLAVVVRRATGVDVDIYIKNGPKRHVFVTEKWIYKDFFGYLDIIKEGTSFTAAVAQQGVDAKGKIYTRNKKVYTFNDLNNEYQLDLASIGMHIGSYGTTPAPTQARIRGMEVKKVNQQEGIEYIGDIGDIFTFDHKAEKILKNGEVFTRKDFGARFFHLKPGVNGLVFNPPEVIESIGVSWRERYK